MPESLRCVPSDSLVVGWDFSTGSVKALAFDLNGDAVAEARLPTDLWTDGGVAELSLLQLEGQARCSTRMLAGQLKALGRLEQWRVCGISATHHSAGRIDANGAPVRRLICWNDQTLGAYHAEGLARLGGQDRARALTGGPWAVRYSLSHLVKDEATLAEADWARTARLVQHGTAAAGYLTGNFDRISASAAASTGMLDLRTGRWQPEMLNALKEADHRIRAWRAFPTLIAMDEPLGPLSEAVAADCGLPAGVRPLVFPTLDDQAAGLVGGGATDPGHVAVILGNSAVVNSSSDALPQSGTLDAMKLNWGPYLWMRCYSNGAQFLDRIVGPNPDWPKLEAAARAAAPNSVGVLPFVLSEPSLGVQSPRFEWFPTEPSEAGVRLRASFEAIAFLIALAVKEHEAAGQTITRVTVSGGIAKSDLMLEILASVLDRPLDRLVSSEGPALGAAVVALAGFEQHLRKQRGVVEPFTTADAVRQLVKFRAAVQPRAEWVSEYRKGLAVFADRLKQA